MVELLASGMTGGRASLDVQPLKVAEGEPHGLGQYFVLIDPEASDAFAARLASLIAAVEAEGAGETEDGGGRLPGRGRPPLDAVEVPDALWSLCRGLAGG